MLKQLYVEMTLYQERMHKKSKQKFREYLQTKAKENNLCYQITPDSIFSKNVIIGDLENARYVFGAHYDTPPRMPAFLIKNILVFNIILFVLIAVIFSFGQFLKVPPIISILICILIILYPAGIFAIANKYNFNDNTSGVLLLLHLMTKLDNSKVAYVFFDNEEKGLIGSIQLLAYLRKNKIKMFSKKIFVFDCIGRGNLFKAMHYHEPKLANEFKEVFEKTGIKDYNIEVSKGNSLEMSDHAVFRQYYHTGIMCYEKRKNKYVITNIHSHKDKDIDLKNLIVLSKVIEEIVR